MVPALCRMHGIFFSVFCLFVLIALKNVDCFSVLFLTDS